MRRAWASLSDLRFLCLWGVVLNIPPPTPHPPHTPPPPTTGSHKLLFGCALWVFNCTGVPVALRQSGEGGMRGEGGEPGYHTLLDDEEVSGCFMSIGTGCRSVL